MPLGLCMREGGRIERMIEALASTTLKMNAVDGPAVEAVGADLARLEEWITGAAERGLAAVRTARRALDSGTGDVRPPSAARLELEPTGSRDVEAGDRRLECITASIAVLQELFVEGTDPAALVVPELESTGDAASEEPAADDDGLFFMLGEAAGAVIDHQLLPTFIREAAEHLDLGDLVLLELETDPANEEHLNALFRSMHSLKGSSAMVGLTRVKELAHQAEQVLDAARRGEIRIDGAVTDVMFEVLDELRRLVARASELGPDATSEDDGAPPRLFEMLRRLVAGEPVDALLREPAATAARSAAPEPSARPARTDPTTSSPSPGRTVPRDNVKVDAERLDRLIDAIGELVIAQSMVTHSAALRASEVFPFVARQLQQLDKISRALQQMATALRMVPLRDSFERMRRIVRDVAKRSDKEVKLTLAGEGTELDKAVVDTLTDPLMHLVRNAVDHGLEGPERRAAAGKPLTGHLELAARHVGDEVHIEVRDDGRGLDTDAIMAKAIERGIIEPGRTLSEAEVFDLIFAPGFSTAAVVTDISGRGVGMDVVRRAIESLRGKIHVRSVRGKGATFEIRLPLTLAVIDGMLVSVGGRRYVVPTLSVVCTVQRGGGEIVPTLGGGCATSLNGAWIPLHSLEETLTPSAQTSREPIGDDGRALVMVVEHGSERVGFVVDQLLGQQHIVIKSLGPALDIPAIAGGAILPDGTVGLVLELGGLLDLTRRSRRANDELAHAV